MPDVGGIGRALEHVPGLLTLKGGYLGQPAGLILGGIEPLILMDGVRAAKGGSGDFDLSSISTISLDRVEILREGSSSLYGNGAGSGIVNLIGKRFPGGKPFTKVGLARGTYDTQLTQAEFTRGMGEKLGLYLTWDWERTDGHRANSDSDRKSVDGALSYQLREGLMMGLRGARVESRRGLPGTSDNPSSRRSGGTQESVVLTIEGRNTSLRAYGREVDVELESPDLTESSTAAGFSLTRSIGCGKHLLLLGTDGREEDVGGERSGSHRRGEVGVLLADQMELHPLIVFIPSLRYDFPSREISPKAGLAYRPALDRQLFCSVGRSFRTPTLSELYLSGQIDSVGNPDLREETALHANLGCGYERDAISLKGSLIWSRIADRIGWRREGGVWTATNLGASSSKGLEMSLERGALRGISAGGGVCYQRFSGESPPYIPELRLDFWVGYGELFKEENLGLNLKLAGEYVGQRFSEEGRMAPHLLFDLRVALRIIDLSLFYQADNLLAESYELRPDYPMPGRTISFGLSWEFWD